MSAIYEARRNSSANHRAMSEHPEVVSTKTVFEGRVFDVRIDTVRYADGTEHRVDVVAHGASYAIFATTPDERVVLVRQYRHAAGAELWEIPAGTAEPGEDPAAGAARELAEETGYRAAGIRKLTTAYMTPGFCDEIMYFFRADGLQAGAQDLDEDERIEVGLFTRDEAWRLVAKGAILDAKTLLALLWTEGARGELTDDFGR